MADPDHMDYIMDAGHDESLSNTSAVAQCSPRSPHTHQNPNNFGSHSRDAHHYDPVHNRETWENAIPPGQSQYSMVPMIPQHSAPWAPSWDLRSQPWLLHPAEVRRGPPTGYIPPGFQQPGYAHAMGNPHGPWGPVPSYDLAPPSTTFYPNFMGTGGSGAPIAAGRSSMPRLPHADIAAAERGMGTYTSVQAAHLQRLQTEERMRQVNAARATRGTMQGRASTGVPDHDSRGLRGSFLPSSQNESYYPRRSDETDWDSEDEDETLGADSVINHSNMMLGDDTTTASDRPSRQQALARQQRLQHAASAAIQRAAMAKRVPSKEFIASLERLDPSEIPETDRTCSICFNEYGVENPEGVVEKAIRLPKCKHIYGEKCIARWFESSDSCPYCRDKLPSQAPKRNKAHMEALIRARAQTLAADPQFAYYDTDRNRRIAQYSMYGRPDGTHSNQTPRTDPRHNFTMSNSNEPIASPSSSRSRGIESPRRQARGRAGLGRPVSFGSATVIAPSLSRPVMESLASLQHEHTLRLQAQHVARTIAPQATIAPSTITHSAGPTTPSRRGPSSFSMSPEEVSPPVAVGSGPVPGSNNLPPARSFSSNTTEGATFDQWLR